MRTPSRSIPPVIAEWVQPWTHWGYLGHVIDGDTLDVTERLPYGITVPGVLLRLVGIQAPEFGGSEKLAAAASKRHLADLIGTAPLVWHTASDRKDRYGRYIARVMVADEWPPLDLSVAILQAQHARHFLVPRTNARLAPILFGIHTAAEAADQPLRGH